MTPAEMRSGGGWTLAAAGALGVATAAYGYLVLGSGIDHTPGALLVVFSTVLLTAAAAVLVLAPAAPAPLRIALAAAAALDLAGTGLAAWFLHSWMLLLLMAAGAIAWLVWAGGWARRR
jgi:hypothetical protein